MVNNFKMHYYKIRDLYIKKKFGTNCIRDIFVLITKCGKINNQELLKWKIDQKPGVETFLNSCNKT